MFEKPPTNKTEKKENREDFPSKENIINFLSSSLENGSSLMVSRENYDDKGLVLLDLQSEENEEGEVYSYEYLRKGRHDNISSGAIETKISLVIYKNGIPIGGDDFAIFDEVSGKFNLI
jgi:hypothetical protein